MMRKSRLFEGKLVVGLLLTVFITLLVGSIATAAPVTKGTLKLAHVDNEIDLISSPYLALTSVFKNIVESETNGRFKVQVFPAKQMGDLADLMEQCAKGVIQLTTSQNVSTVASIYPDIQLLEMPYAFQNTEVARRVLDGAYGKGLSDRIAKKTGLRNLVWLPSALRSFANNSRPIKTPADMKGLKIRVMPAPVHIEMIKALGGQPTPIAWGELYTALQTGVVDGYEQAPYSLLMGKLEEVTKYFSVDNHMLNVVSFFINEKFYQNLTPEDRRIFDYAAREAQLAFLGVVKAKEASDFKQMQSKGVKINAIDPKGLKAFKDLAQPAAISLLKKTVSQQEMDLFLKAIKEAEKQTGLQ